MGSFLEQIGVGASVAAAPSVDGRLHELKPAAHAGFCMASSITDAEQQLIHSMYSTGHRQRICVYNSGRIAASVTRLDGLEPQRAIPHLAVQGRGAEGVSATMRDEPP